LAIVDMHHAIPDPLRGNATGAPQLPAAAGNGSVSLTTTTPPPTAHSYGGNALGFVGGVLLAIVLVVIAYWILVTISGWSEEPRAASGRGGGKWRPPSGVYKYPGPRMLLRDAFVRLRTGLEAVRGPGIKHMTLRELARAFRLGLGEAEEEYYRAMYSRYVPEEEQAERVASRLREAGREWRARE